MPSRRQRQRQRNPSAPAPQQAPAAAPPAAGTQPAVAAAIAATATCVLMLVTLQTHLPGGDAPELVTAALTGGVAHPPGYPLHALLLRGAFAVCRGLGLGTPALWANALSALSAAITAGAVSAAVARRSGSRAVAVASGMGVWVMTTAWLCGTGAEVFALNTALCAVVLERLDRPVTQRASVMGTAVCVGLALSNHHTAVLLLAPPVAWWVWSARGPAEARAYGRMVAGVLLGLSPYALLPLWGQNAAAMTWGDWTGLPGLITHVLRSEYGTLALQADGSPVGLWTSLAQHARVTWQEAAALPALGLGVALMAALWRGPPAIRAVGLGVVLHLGVFHALNNMPATPPLLAGVQARFYVLPWMACWLLVGCQPWGRITEGRKALGLAAGVLTLALLNGPRVWDARSPLVEAYGRELLRVQPPNALVLTRGDLITGTLRYLQAAEGLRPDVTLVDQETLSRTWGVAAHQRALPHVVFPGAQFHPQKAGGFHLRALAEANATRPLVVCGGTKAGDTSLDARAQVPLGVCARVLAPGDAMPDPASWLDADAAQQAPDGVTLGPWLNRTWPPGSWEAVAQSDLLDVRPRQALHVMVTPSAAVSDEARHDAAAAWLTSALEGFPAAPIPPHVFKNLGLACARATPTAAHRTCMRDAWTRWLDVGPRDDKDREAIARAVNGP